jgi:zinc/manganese transport system ATP-binding protein
MTAAGPKPTSTPSVRLTAASLRFGARTLWSSLELTVAPGEFVALLGSNGTGKSALLRTILGLQPLTTGLVEVDGMPARRGNDRIGYIPQERRIDPPVPVRVADLVAMGLHGSGWGPGRHRRERRRQVAAALDSVGAGRLADAPVQQLSGGEQQRVRIAQAIATDPSLLLCDEPLLSLDVTSQDLVVRLIDARRRSHRTAVVFVTHEINPVLPYVDRVLYLADGRFRIGSVDAVMTSASLSALYGSAVEVLRVGDRILVAGAPDRPPRPAADHRVHQP